MYYLLLLCFNKKPVDLICIARFSLTHPHTTAVLQGTLVSAFGKGLALKFPSNETTTFVNTTLGAEVAVPAAAWKIWKRMYGSEPSSSADVLGAAESDAFECALTVHVEASLEGSDALDPDDVGDSGGLEDEYADEEEEDVEEEGEDGPRVLPKTLGGKNVTRAIQIDPPSLCFHPSIDTSNKRSFRITSTRPGLINLTFTLSGPAATFFSSQAASSLVQMHYPLVDPAFDITSTLGLGGTLP